MSEYVVRHGKRIAVEVCEPGGPARKKRGFEARWVKFPARWIEALEQTRSANTFKLALWILLAAYENKNGSGWWCCQPRRHTGCRLHPGIWPCGSSFNWG
jgi:hypothetical protein